MAPPSPPSVMAVAAITAVTITFQAVSATWCIIRSEASEQALQKALDYACWAGADCEPIKSSGLCFLPNTLQAHASYAFNSYYQRKARAPSSCDFSGTATVAKTDPSYGSCVYPSTSSTAGGTIPPPIPGTTIPIINAQPPPSNLGTEGVIPGRGPALPDTTPSNANPMSSTTWMLIPLCFSLSLLCSVILIYR